jgi:hypothetical protein
MGQKSGPVKEPAEQVMKEIRRATRRQFSAEEKIRIVLSGLRGEDSIAELCRREGIVASTWTAIAVADHVMCQTASNRDPGSASSRDPSPVLVQACPGSEREGPARSGATGTSPA